MMGVTKKVVWRLVEGVFGEDSGDGILVVGGAGTAVGGVDGVSSECDCEGDCCKLQGEIKEYWLVIQSRFSVLVNSLKR